MSIVEQPRNESQNSDQENVASTAVDKPPRKRSFGKLAALMSLGLLALAWFAPAIVASTGMMNSAIATLLPEFEGQIRIERASLAWLSPIQLEAVSVTDADAKDLATVESITTDNSLWTLIRNRSDLGKITVREPRLTIVVRTDGSNLEDALAPLLKKEGQSSFHITLQDASVSVSTVESDSVEITNIDAEFSNLTDSSVFDIRSSGKIQDGSFDLTAIARRSESTMSLEDVSFTSDELPLDVSAPIFTRFNKDAAITGQMTGTVKAERVSSTELSTTTDLTLASLNVHSTELFGEDRLQADNAQLKGSIQRKADSVSVDMHLISDLGQVDLRASAALDQYRESGFVSGLLHTAKSESFSAKGNIDLQGLAEVLPHVLHIRDGAHIDSGKLSFDTESIDTETGHAWTAKANASDLKVNVDGKQHAWKSPLTLNAKLRAANNSFVIDELDCRSDFLTVSGSGSTSNANLTASADLDLLMQEIGQLIDLGDVSVSGQSKATFKIQLEDKASASIRGHAELNNFELSAAGQSVSEQKLSVDFTSIGTLENSRVTELVGTLVEINSGSDKLSLSFTKPIQLGSASANYDARLTLVGNAKTWKDRAAQFLPMQSIDVAGQLNAEADIQFHGQELSLSNAKVHSRPFRFANEFLDINEPELTAQVNGIWSGAQQKLTIDAATIQSQALNADISNFAVALVEEDEASTNGIVKFDGDLGAIQHWLKSEEPPTTKANGAISGTLKLDHRGKSSTAELVSQLKQLQLLELNDQKQWAPYWSKDQVDAQSSLQYVPSSDTLTVNRFSLATTAGVLNLSGDVLQLKSTADANLKGDMEYDVAEVVASFKDIVGGSVTATGRQKRSLELKGPLAKILKSEIKASQRVPPELIALGGIGWQSANFYGLDAGPASIDAQLNKQVLQFAPVNMTVGGGRVNLAPQFRFDDEATRLVHGKADVIQQVRLSREVCREWLKYVAPQVADSTAVEGHFSLSLTETDVPIDDPASGTVAGVLGIQSAKVSGGPMILSIASIASRVEGIVRRRSPRQILNATKPLFQIRDQSVGFKLVDRRMHHSDFEVIVDNMPITTSGSVGFDESIDLMVRFPIPEAWLGSNKFLVFLKGVELEVPISGTLDRPKVDERVFATLLKRIGRDSVKSIINNGVESQLKKLFGR